MCKTPERLSGFRRTMRRAVAVVCTLAAGAAWLFPGATARAGVAQSDAHDYFHLQWGQDEYPSVGLLNVNGTLGSGICSGVLIHPRILLTAGHCVVEPGLGSLTSATFTVGGQTYNAQSWGAHHKWTGTNLTTGVDIAMIKLDRPVTNVQPSKYAISGNEVGEKVVSVGFGAGGTGDFGYFLPAGDKRAGENIVDFAEGPRDRMLLYDFDSPDQVIESVDDYPLSLEYIAAPGDSGGGLFVNSKLVGITSFILGTDGFPDADFGDFAGYTRVSKHWRWIRKMQRSLLRNRDKPGIGTPDDPLGLPTGNPNVTLTYRGGVVRAVTSFTPVPEPMSAALLALGGVTLLRRGRRRAA